MEEESYKSATKDASKVIPRAKHIVATRILMGATFSTMILGIPLVVMGFWLALIKHKVLCFRFLEVPIIFIGIGLVVCGIVGMVGAYRLGVHMLWAYMVLAFLLILLLFAFTVFTFYVINGGQGHNVTNASYLEYRLHDYSLWFQGQLGDAIKWPGIRGCLREERICAGLERLYPSEDAFYMAPLSPVQSGCCKPPSACKFEFRTATQWEITSNPEATSDCGRWDNNLSQLCFGCSSCRAGVIQIVKGAWNVVALVCLPVLVLLVLAYCIGWLAFFKGLWDDIFTPLSKPLTSPKNGAP